jgi:hypothetical protein
MCRACSMPEIRNVNKILARKEEIFQRSSLRWAENIKTYIEETGCEEVIRVRSSGILL